MAALPNAYAIDPATGKPYTKSAPQVQPNTTPLADTQGFAQPNTPPLAPGFTEPVAKTAPASTQQFSNVNDAFTSFVNSNPAYKTGGQAAIDAFAQQYPQFAGVVAWSPNRSIYEVQGGYLTNLPGGTGGWSMTATSPESGAPAPAAAPAVAADQALSITKTPNPADDALRAQLVAQLQTRANQTLNVDPTTDPAITAPTQAYGAAQQQERAKYLKELAEQAGPNGNITDQTVSSGEQVGQATGQYSAGLVANEIAARRQEIQDALASEQGLLTADQTSQLEEELAKINAAGQKYGIDMGAATTSQSLAQQWQQALMNNQQFLDSLGLQAEQQYNTMTNTNSGVNA